MTVLCLVETDADGIRDPSLRALAVARALAESAGEDLVAVWIEGKAGAGEAGAGEAGAGEAGVGEAAGADRGCAIDLGSSAGYAPVAWARALAGLAGTDGAELGFGPVSAVIAAATDRGNEVLAHLGAITGLPMAANCVSASWAVPGKCELVRQRWAGSLLEDAVLDAPLALLTVAADAVTAEQAVAGVGGSDRVDVPVSRCQPTLADSDLLVQATVSADRRAGVSLATARVVVGGGRGVGGPDGFTMLEELADLLGGALGVSRVVTSQGWRPHRQQVGQTGTKISPELYLACGISGAIQHMAGCQGAKTIVAINTDPDAPMVAKADYAVVGDLHQVIPALIEALRQRGS